MTSRRVFRIGLTGGIGTGKSTALAVFRALGAHTISADEIAHELSRRGRTLHRVIVRAFGDKFLRADGELDRRALGEAVFSHPALRRRLERVTHPQIAQEMRRQVRACRRPVLVADVPLLFEKKYAKEFDATMVVAAPAGVCVRRVMRRSRWSRAQVRARMRAQWALKRKTALADVTLINRGRRSALRRQIAGYYRAAQWIARSPI